MWKWCLLAVIAWCPNAQALDEAALAALLEEARTEMDMPGLRAAVRLSDGKLVRAAVGLADVETEIALDDTIGMPGGSTGKTFAAALTLLLVEDGALTLDDPVSMWLGDTDWYRKLPNADSIRVRHLLSRSAGISDYPSSFRWNLAMIWRVIRKGSAYFEPEELIGYALEGNPTMLVEFYAALAEGRLVRSETFAQMLEGGWRDPDDPNWHYAFGVFVNHGGRSFGHGGLWPGYRTQVDHDVTTGTTIAVQTNRDGQLDMRGLGARIKELVQNETD